jgi:hypothetical protein
MISAKFFFDSSFEEGQVDELILLVISISEKRLLSCSTPRIIHISIAS